MGNISDFQKYKYMQDLLKYFSKENIPVHQYINNIDIVKENKNLNNYIPNKNRPFLVREVNGEFYLEPIQPEPKDLNEEKFNIKLDEKGKMEDFLKGAIKALIDKRDKDQNLSDEMKNTINDKIQKAYEFKYLPALFMDKNGKVTIDPNAYNMPYDPSKGIPDYKLLYPQEQLPESEPNSYYIGDNPNTPKIGDNPNVPKIGDDPNRQSIVIGDSLFDTLDDDMTTMPYDQSEPEDYAH